MLGVCPSDQRSPKIAAPGLAEPLWSSGCGSGGSQATQRHSELCLWGWDGTEVSGLDGLCAGEGNAFASRGFLPCIQVCECLCLSSELSPVCVVPAWPCQSWNSCWIPAGAGWHHRCLPRSRAATPGGLSFLGARLHSSLLLFVFVIGF